MVTLSILPRETLAGWLALLLPIAVYLLTRATPVKWLRGLLVLMFAVAAFEAVLGLVQFGTGPDSLFYFGMEYTHRGSAVGTYTSRNNFVGFMYLSLMVSLALFMATLGRHKRAAGQQSLRDRLVYFASPEGHRAFVYGALALLLLLAVIFSRSRAGIGLTMLGLVLASLAFSRRIGGGNVYGLTGTIVSGVFALGITIGLGPVLDRFSAQDPLSDGRWTIFDGVFQGIGQFFPLGAGTGTFVQTFPQFQDISQAAFLINRAHNSYLEWVYNGGVAAMILIAAFLAYFAARWFKVWKKGEWGEFRYIQVGAGLGMLLMLLHETVDYNLFVPANMVYFAFFAGLFFYPYEEPALRHKKRRERSEDHTSQARTVADPLLQPVDSGPQTNPFMD
jgi:O-antigen ligase